MNEDAKCPPDLSGSAPTFSRHCSNGGLGQSSVGTVRQNPQSPSPKVKATAHG